VEYLTIDELCKTLKVHRNTITRRCDIGMPFITIGRNKRFNLEKVIDWLDTNEGIYKKPKKVNTKLSIADQELFDKLEAVKKGM
jgi:excisionase family DNA binding protein